MMHEYQHRSLPKSLARVVGELELRNAVLVTADELAKMAGLQPHSAAARNLVRHLVGHGWLRAQELRGHYEFLPGRAGPYSREDALDPLRAMLRHPGREAQVALAGAAFLRGFADRAPVLFDVLVPQGTPISGSLRAVYRFHWVSPTRLFGGEPLDGVPVSSAERLLVDVALWPTGPGLGPSLRAGDHWLGAALRVAALDTVVEMLRRLGSPTATARAGYLAHAFGRSDIADAIAQFARSRVATPLLPGVEPRDEGVRDRRFNVIDPIGAGSVA